MSEITESMLFKQKLYENFKESGLLSKLKTSLRANLLQKLEKPVPTNEPNKDDTQKDVPFHLRHKFLQSIIAEYLLMQKQEYSLSIFMAECNLQEQDCLRYNELSEITNLGTLSNGKSFLFRLMEQFGKIRCQQAKERSTQTDFSEPLGKKLQQIDNQYKPKIDYWKLIPNSSIDKVPDSLYEHQQKLRMKFNAQKEQFRKELQLNLKQEIQKKYENQYLFRMREVQKQHQGRLNELKLREKTILDGLQKKKRDLQQKSKDINETEMKMINKYELKMQQLEQAFRTKQKELQAKQKQFWKRQLQLKAKKREYEDTIRLVKQKVINESIQ